MKYENIKSIILTVLILISIVLTWSLWTFQPNYDTLESSNYVAEISVSEKQELHKIIRPDLALFHIKDKHHGTTNSEDLSQIMKEIRSWSFYDVKNVSDRVENIKELMHGSGNVEIVFPGEIPIELYRGVLKFEEKKIPSFNFNRIIINVDHVDKENGTVYFVSTESNQVYMSHISTPYINEFNRSHFKNANAFPPYFPFEATSQRTIFIPEGEQEMLVYKYLPAVLNSEEFKEALFSDPGFVQKSPVPNGEEYTDVSSKMTVDNETNMLLYVNPTVESKYYASTYDLVKRSIDFINEHGGWTDPYRYVAKDEYNQAVTFRLYSLDGIPVFNERGLSEIEEVWGRDEISKYERPNISLELPLLSEMQYITLPSGSRVLEFLQSRNDFKPELLEQLILGYRMERDKDANQVIHLEPAWFYLYDQSWGQITDEDLGGLLRGLE
jgi:regulatory protein YycH of two-component signal transduction system YycFG